MEEWRDIEGYEGIYQVSSYGNVRRVIDDEIGIYAKVLKPRVSKQKPYYIVALCDNGKRKERYIHRLVAAAFIPNIDGKREVNHIDGNKKNNHVENLEWVTHEENIHHAVITGLFNNHSKSVVRSDGVVFQSMREAVRKTPKTYVNCISECCKGNRKTAGGYGWRYVE